MRNFKSHIRHVIVGLSLAFAVVSCGQEPQRGTVAEASAFQLAYDAGTQILYGAKDRFEYPKAIEHLTQAVAADEGSAKARLALSYALLKRSKYEDAAPHIAAANLLRDQLSPEQAHWLDALSARIADKTEAEIRAWNAAVAAAPENRWAWYELASAYSVLEDYANAADAAAKAAATEPDPAKWEASWLYYLHSKALYRSGQYEAAIPAADAGLGNATTLRSTYFRKALAQAKLGANVDDLVAEYNVISDKEGRNNTAYTQANIALFYFELGDYAKAVEHARTSWSLQPGGYPAWTLAYSLIENDQLEEALAFLVENAPKYPDNVFVTAAKGWAHYRAGQLEAARDALLAARKLSPRRQYRVEHDLSIVEDALANPDAPAAPKIAWLG